MVEINQNDLKPRSEQDRMLQESANVQKHLDTFAANKKQFEQLTPEEQKTSLEQQELLNSAIDQSDVLRINEIIRSSSLRRLLPPKLIRQAFEKLRSIHRDTVNHNIDTGNMGIVRDEIGTQLDQVATGYHEIFKNLQNHIEQTGTLVETNTEDIISLQDEVAAAEQEIKTLLKRINTDTVPAFIQS